MTRRFGYLLSGLVAVVLLGSCLGDPTGLGSRAGMFGLAPRFASLLADALVDVAAVRILVTLPGSNTTALDTAVTFPAGQDSIAVRLTVPMNSPSVDFILRLAMTNPAGDTVFRAGPSPLRLSTTPGSAPVAAPTLVYVGVGASATGVRFVNPPSALSFGQSVTLVAEAFDAQGAAIPGTPIGFVLANPADSVRAVIPDPKTGLMTARAVRGTVNVRAELLTGPSATRTVTIQPVAAGVVAQSGGGQSGTVGAALAQPFVARVRAADSLGVAGVPVQFEVLSGGGTLNRLVDTTDANGDARATLTLGTGIGAQSARVVVPSLGGATASFAATAVAGAATSLAFVVQPTNSVSAVVIAPPITVRALDQFGNLATAFTGSVTVALLNNPSAAVIGGTVTRAAVAGVATFYDVTVTGVGTGITMGATSGALTAGPKRRA